MAGCVTRSRSKSSRTQHPIFDPVPGPCARRTLVSAAACLADVGEFDPPRARHFTEPMLGENARYRRQVYRIAGSQGWFCFWCDLPINEITVTRDHLKPKCRGGTNVMSNIVASCYGCNQHKAAREAPGRKYLAMRRRQYLREIAGLYCVSAGTAARNGLENFGRDPRGAPLVAPQYGIV